jgi:hypothetical protein
MSQGPTRGTLRTARVCFAATLTLLLVGVAPVPPRWSHLRELLGAAKSPELNRADRDELAGGYYEGLIGGGDGADASHGDLALRILGKPVDWARFHAANVTRALPGDILQFELRPDIRKTLFGRPFTTNSHGQRDHPHELAKPQGIYRIALLGSSIDMGWGVDIDQVYLKRLESWLNLHALRRGATRRFESINFAVAAYSPVQRLETFHRKVLPFKPDLVIFSSTMLDIRLTEIHLCDSFQDPGVNDLRFDFLRKAVADAGISADELARDPQGKLARKDVIKSKLRPFYWSIYDHVLGTLAADCRSAGIAVACVIIPRAGTSDSPDARAESVARIRGLASRHALPLLDLSETFDEIDPTRIEIAASDDHPNAYGHDRLFLALARALVQDRGLYEEMFLTGGSEPIPGAAGLQAALARPVARPQQPAAEVSLAPQPSGAEPSLGVLDPTTRIRVLTRLRERSAIDPPVSAPDRGPGETETPAITRPLP